MKVDIFGRKANLESDDLSKLSVLEKMGLKSCGTAECLRFHQRGFIAVGRLPKKGKKQRHCLMQLNVNFGVTNGFPEDKRQHKKRKPSKVQPSEISQGVCKVKIFHR